MNSFSWGDWFFFISPLAFVFFFLLKSKAQNTSLKSYFQAEGKMGWFVSGTAMVATTFAADTPLAVTEIVRKDGISGNWIWWSLALGGLSTVFLFAPLWRRSGATTDLELIQLRYSGKLSVFLRGFKAVFIGYFLNTIVLGWVNLAMFKILQVFFPGLPAEFLLLCLIGLGVIYTSIAGLSGISKIDVFQFFLAWGGCIVYAIFLILGTEIGGFAGLKESLASDKLNFFPSIGSNDEIAKFSILIFVVWWSSWYPGSEPGGGGYIAQRILATKDEKNAILASLWFVFSHYFLRPWPWILVALSSLILFPNLTEIDSGKGFLLPLFSDNVVFGLKGLLLSSFLAAYLSTLATHLNWGASYLIFDLGKGILLPDKQDVFFLRMSWIVQALTAFSSFLLAIYGMETVKGAWEFLLSASSGIGFVLIGRWFYWRLSASSEVLSFVVSPLFYLFYGLYLEIPFPYVIPCISFSSIVAVLIGSFYLPETKKEVLLAFYHRAKPPAFFWKGFFLKNNIEQIEYDNQIALSSVCILNGVALLFSGLYSIGILLDLVPFSTIPVLLFIISILIFVIVLPKRIKNLNL